MLSVILVRMLYPGYQHSTGSNKAVCTILTAEPFSHWDIYKYRYLSCHHGNNAYNIIVQV